jgi:predicted enzyme related to lactoylglutathione lyase
MSATTGSRSVEVMTFPNNTVAHFAINADDVEKSRAFYGRVFGWKFAAWGPPGFYQIEAKDSPVFGALQGRRELVKGHRTIGFECTFAVESIDATEKAVKAAGGKVVLDRSVIVGVGTLMFFADPDGNVFGAMQYDAAAE